MFGQISTLLKVQSKTRINVLFRKKWFRELAEEVPQLVWASDETGKKTYASRRYLDFTGAANLEEMDRSWTGFIHPEDRAKTANNWLRSIASGEPYTAEYRMRRRDGTFRHIKAQALPAFDAKGHINGWLGMSNDIDEEKAARQARELEEKLVAVRRLASSIAHDLNNPLAGVTNALFLALSDNGLAANTRNYLQMANAELHRLSRTAAHSLRFHNQSRSLVRKRPSQILDDVLSIYESRFGAAGVITLRDYQRDAELLCCADDLSQAFASIIRNALDATAAGGKLRVRIRTVSNQGSGKKPRVRITIADNGHGIDHKASEFVFQPFFTTRSNTHTGLALWNTRQIILRHGGRISFRSSSREEQHGTVFVIVLPLNGADADCGNLQLPQSRAFGLSS